MNRMRAWPLLFLAACAAGGDVNAPRPLMGGSARPEEVAGEVAGGLRWTIRMRRNFSAVEPLPVCWTLENATERAATAVFDDALQPRIVLTLEGHATREAAESDFRGYASRYGAIHPDAKSLVHRMDVHDFRFMFGRLEPGKYGLQLVWPAGGVRLEGERGEARDLASPVFAFEVRATSLRHADTNNVRDRRAEIVLREPERDKEGALRVSRADLVNRSGGDLVIAASIVTEGVRRWDRPQLSWEGWVPDVGWARLDGPWQFCGTGRSEITLKPGTSLEIALERLGDGIHRFDVPSWPAEAPRNRFVARSRAILVDDFDAAWKQALKEKMK